MGDFTPSACPHCFSLPQQCQSRCHRRPTLSQDSLRATFHLGPGYYGWKKLPEPYCSNLSQASLTALFSNFPPDWPEIEWLPVSAYIGNNENKQTADPRDGSNYATSSNAIISPLSRSTVSLQGPEMTTPPVIDPAWITHPADKELAIQGFKRQRQVWEVLVDLGIADPVEAFPGANVTTDADILGMSSDRPVPPPSCRAAQAAQTVRYQYLVRIPIQNRCHDVVADKASLPNTRSPPSIG
jgi:hypothetical protein